MTGAENCVVSPPSYVHTGKVYWLCTGMLNGQHLPCTAKLGPVLPCTTTQRALHCHCGVLVLQDICQIHGSRILADPVRHIYKTPQQIPTRLTLWGPWEVWCSLCDSLSPSGRETHLQALYRSLTHTQALLPVRWHLSILT